MPTASSTCATVRSSMGSKPKNAPEALPPSASQIGLTISSMDDLRKPILPGTAASDYERYLRTDELLSLQKKHSELLHDDEMTFQVVHQSSELLLKGAAFELERALERVSQGDFANAARLVRRANMEIDFPIAQLHIL